MIASSITTSLPFPCIFLWMTTQMFFS